MVIDEVAGIRGNCKIAPLLRREVGVALAHLIVVIYDVEAQALEFLLESQLNKIMGCSVGSSSVLFTVEPVITVEVMILATWTHGGGFHKSWNR